MREQVLGYSQKGMLELNLKSNELVVLGWFVRYSHTRNTIEEEGKVYYSFSYEDMIRDLPALFINNGTEVGVMKKAQRLLNGNLSKVLEKKVQRGRGGTYIYLAINAENYEKLLIKE